MYNPFKSHVVKFQTGLYGIRKLTLIGFQYLDLDDRKRWWVTNNEYVQRDEIEVLNIFEEMKDIPKRGKRVLTNR